MERTLNNICRSIQLRVTSEGFNFKSTSAITSHPGHKKKATHWIRERKEKCVQKYTTHSSISGPDTWKRVKTTYINMKEKQFCIDSKVSNLRSVREHHAYYCLCLESVHPKKTNTERYYNQCLRWVSVFHWNLYDKSPFMF